MRDKIVYLIYNPRIHLCTIMCFRRLLVTDMDKVFAYSTRNCLLNCYNFVKNSTNNPVGYIFTHEISTLTDLRSSKMFFTLCNKWANKDASVLENYRNSNTSDKYIRKFVSRVDLR